MFKKLFLKLNRQLGFKAEKRSVEDKVRDGLVDTLERYQYTLKALEKYDRGELPEAESMVRHTSLRDYLQRLQNATRIST